MANLDRFLLQLKRKMKESGFIDIDDPDDTANELFEIFKSRGLNTDSHDDCLPIFSRNRDIVHPSQIHRLEPWTLLQVGASVFLTML